MFVLGCLIQSSTFITGKQTDVFSSFLDIKTDVTIQNNVTIEFVTDIPSHRSDGIPSVLPDSTVSFQFNITNMSDFDLRELEIFPKTNSFGEILNNVTSTQSFLEQGESWISEEYNVGLTSDGTGFSSALDLAIVLDQSGSMGDEISVLTSNLVDVIDEIDENVPDLEVGLILFGGQSCNPYSDSNLIYDLTPNVEDIVSVLAKTKADGGVEPWGDALYVAENWLDWRENSVKLIILITDEPNNGGQVIGDGTGTYDGPLLYNLFEDLYENGFILCTIAASGSSSLTIDQLEAGAEATNGTYIELGGDGPQTEDIPMIIGELILKYAVELDLKITGVLSYLTYFDTREQIEETFTILIDDIPPEIESWIYFSEDLITDDKFINIMSQVKDVTGASFVEIFYKFDSNGFWIAANASHVFNDTYLLTLQIFEEQKMLYYQFYTEDWLGNSNFTDIFEVDLTAIDSYSTIDSCKRKEVLLIPNQSIYYKLKGIENLDSIGLVFSNNFDEFDIIIADVNDAEIKVNKVDIFFQNISIPANHEMKVSLIAKEIITVNIVNVVPEKIKFGDQSERHIGETDAFLFEIDNRIEDNDTRSFMADSQVVQTVIYLYNANNWELITKQTAEVFLPEERCFALVIAVYHVGDIKLSFNYDYINNPYEHYYAAESSWSLFFFIIGILALVYYTRKKR